MKANFNDQFSAHARTYANARPDYPADLFLYLSSLCEQHELAWDCATGNGQAAKSLAKDFARVIATDASAEQIQQAPAVENVEYRRVAAEEQFLPADSVDLVVVAQALHWFDIAAFFENVDCVLKVGGVLAVWTYGLPKINDPIDRLVQKLYADILDDYWPAERRIVEQAYANVDFPYREIAGEEFKMSRRWSLAQLSDFIMSWSAVQRYMEKQGSNPLQSLDPELREAWGTDPQQAVEVQWPMVLKLGRKEAAG